MRRQAKEAVEKAFAAQKATEQAHARLQAEIREEVNTLPLVEEWHGPARIRSRPYCQRCKVRPARQGEKICGRCG
jgi:hypothetical protein